MAIAVAKSKQASSKGQPFNLTSDNYYSDDASWHYLSKSLYSEFSKCEAETIARLKNEYKPDTDIKALLVGNYVHSYFESRESHENFCNEHAKQIYKYGKQEKGIKKDYELADKMIATLEEEPLFQNAYMPGEKEKIVTGEIDGVKWKGKIDSLNLEKRYFCDLKTTADIHKRIWNPEYRQWQNFVQAYGYFTQIALYKELIKQTFGVDCTPFIFAVSKQTTPDKMAIKFTSGDDVAELSYAMTELKEKEHHMLAVLNGEEKPTMCGKCDYCRSVKHLTDFVSASAIEVE